MNKTHLAILLVAASALVWASCTSSDSSPSENDTATKKTQQAASAAGQPTGRAQSQTLPTKRVVSLPAVARQTTIDLDGNTHRLSEWIGQKPVVINFWGTWCPPCRREIPGLVRLYDEYKDQGIEIISLAIERTAGPAQVKQFTRQAGMKWVQLMATDQIVQGFGYTGSVPTTLFLDINGKEVSRHVGARPYEVFKIDFEKLASGS